MISPDGRSAYGFGTSSGMSIGKRDLGLQVADVRVHQAVRATV